MFAGVALILFVAITIPLLHRWRTNAHRNPKRLPYPPGPRGIPFVGNIRDMPSKTDLEWKTYAEWGRKYGQFALRTIRTLVELVHWQDPSSM